MLAKRPLPTYPLRPLSLCIACLLPLCGEAADWQFSPRLSLEETHTDNVLLAPRGEEGDFISSVTPGFTLRGRGPRLVTSIDYNLQRLEYLDKTELGGTNHQLQSSVDLKLLPEWFAVRSEAHVRQEGIDNRGLITLDNRGPDQNRRDVVSYDVAPRFEHTWGSWASTTLEYENLNVDQSGRAVDLGLANPAGSSSEDTYRFKADSGSRFGRMPVSFTAMSREISYQTQQTNKFKQAETSVSYVVNRKFKVTGTGGYEDNSFRSRSGNTGGVIWSIGGTWTPNPRTSLAADWGDRFFGKNFNVHASHTHRHIKLTADYTEDIHTINDFQRQLLQVPAFDQNGQPVIDPLTNGQVFIPVNGPTVTDDSYVERRINFQLDYTLRRGSLAFAFDRSDRTFQSNGRDETTHSAHVNFQRSLNPRLTFSLGAMWRLNEFSTQSKIGRYYTVYPALHYELGPHTSFKLEYDYARNSGATGIFGGFGGGFGSGGFGNGDTANGRSYTENALSAGLVFTL